jgi:hypothetical protein
MVGGVAGTMQPNQIDDIIQRSKQQRGEAHSINSMQEIGTFREAFNLHIIYICVCAYVLV